MTLKGKRSRLVAVLAAALLVIGALVLWWPPVRRQRRSARRGRLHHHRGRHGHHGRRHRHLLRGPLRRPQRRRRHLPPAALRRVDRRVPGRQPERQDQLPGHRLRWRHRAVHQADRRLRRLRRPHEGRGDHRGRDGRRRQGAAHPHRVRLGGPRLQPAGRQGAEARLRHARRHLPGQDHQLERSRDHRSQPGRHPARQGHPGRAPLRLLRHHQHLHQLPDQRRTPTGPTRSGKGKEVKWPVGVGGQGNDGVAAVVKQQKAPSATSNSPTPSSPS